MNERIKEIRKINNLTQQEFADRLKIKRNTVATYEAGKSFPSDAAVSLICREFNVNENWLRTGQGEMFHPASSSSINAVVQEYGLSEPSRIFLEKFLHLAPEHRTVLLNFIKDVASALPNAEKTGSTRQEIDIDAEIANYRGYLESKIDM